MDFGSGFGEHECVTNVTASDSDRPHLKCLLISSNVYLTPNAALEASVLAYVSLAFTFGFGLCCRLVGSVFL